MIMFWTGQGPNCQSLRRYGLLLRRSAALFLAASCLDSLSVSACLTWTRCLISRSSPVSAIDNDDLPYIRHLWVASDDVDPHCVPGIVVGSDGRHIRGESLAISRQDDESIRKQIATRNLQFPHFRIQGCASHPKLYCGVGNNTIRSSKSTEDDLALRSC